MGMFNNEITIDKDNPFEGDKLFREREIRKLTSVFQAVDNQMVLAINSPWGTGKTTFLKMWQAYLNKEGYTTIFFNSWENDFVEEPFIAFIEEIKAAIGTDIDEKFIYAAEKVVKLVVRQIPSILKTVVKNKTGVEVDYNEDAVDDFITDKMKEYSGSKEVIKNFKEELYDIANKNMEKSNKPLVIFVDELDRCRPDFAISLLERIKHFFNISNIIFILGIDKEALSNSIKVVYGEGTNISGYLSRFIDMEYSIKNDDYEEFVSSLLDKYLFSKFCNKIDYYVQDDYDYVKQQLISLFKVFNLPLRELEKVIANLSLIFRGNITYYNIINGYLFSFLYIIKSYDKNLFNKIKNKNITCKEVMRKLDEDYNFSGWVKRCKVGSYFEISLAGILFDDAYVESMKPRVNYNGWPMRKEYERIKGDMMFEIKRKTLFDIIDMYEGIEIISSNK